VSRKSFVERLHAGEVLVSDGATGTNHQHRGLALGDPPEKLLFTKPEQVIGLHREFVEAGADIILTDTFGATAVRLAHAGLDGNAYEVNRLAAEMARKAAEGTDTLVAGSLGPLGQLLEPLGEMARDDAVKNFAEQARALADSGVDLLVIETQFDLAEAQAAVEGVRSATSLPLVCSFSFDMGTRTMMGVKPDQMAQEVASWGADVVGVNCGRSLDENRQALEIVLAAGTGLPAWIKPNAGLPRMGANDIAVYDVSPEQMGEYAARFARLGARIIGGCCGTSPEHLRHIAQGVRGAVAVPA
jgi:5-methyltetrahydrofolate--homocysteine methyltransferase